MGKLRGFAARFAKRFLHATLHHQGIDPKEVYNLAELLESLPEVGRGGTELTPHPSVALQAQLQVRYRGPEQVGHVRDIETDQGHVRVFAYFGEKTGVKFVDLLPSTREPSCKAYALLKREAPIPDDPPYARLEVIVRKAE